MIMVVVGRPEEERVQRRRNANDWQMTAALSVTRAVVSSHKHVPNGTHSCTRSPIGS